MVCNKIGTHNIFNRQQRVWYSKISLTEYKNHYFSLIYQQQKTEYSCNWDPRISCFLSAVLLAAYMEADIDFDVIAHLGFVRNIDVASRGYIQLNRAFKSAGNFLSYYTQGVLCAIDAALWRR